MSSWIRCPCGNDVHKNLFAGASVNILISDDDLDQVDDAWPTDRTMAHVIAKGDILVRCKKCGRILIETKDTREISVFYPEKKE